MITTDTSREITELPPTHTVEGEAVPAWGLWEKDPASARRRVAIHTGHSEDLLVAAKTSLIDPGPALRNIRFVVRLRG